MPFTYLGVASLGVLMALRFVHGSATAVFGPVASATLSDLAPAGRRATWLGTYSTFQGAGQAMGPLAAGYLLASGRYDLAFLLAGAFALAAPFLAARLASPPVTASTARPFHQFARAILEVVRHPLILTTSVAQAAQFVLNGTLNAFLPLFARDTLGLSTSALGWLFALQTVTTLAARPLIGMLSDRIGRRGIIVAGLTICAHGVFGTIYDVGDALGPIAAGVLVASVGYTRMFRVMAAVALIAAAAFYVITRHAGERASA
jgi:MFS family permease